MAITGERRCPTHNVALECDHTYAIPHDYCPRCRSERPSGVR